MYIRQFLARVVISALVFFLFLYLVYSIFGLFLLGLSFATGDQYLSGWGKLIPLGVMLTLAFCIYLTVASIVSAYTNTPFYLRGILLETVTLLLGVVTLITFVQWRQEVHLYDTLTGPPNNEINVDVIGHVQTQINSLSAQMHVLQRYTAGEVEGAVPEVQVALAHAEDLVCFSQWKGSVSSGGRSTQAIRENCVIPKNATDKNQMFTKALDNEIASLRTLVDDYKKNANEQRLNKAERAKKFLEFQPERPTFFEVFSEIFVP